MKKIINDPVYGFVSIEDPLIFDIIHHSYFQRLRRIKQLGLTEYVYPGALHTRFHHALGAMHLMGVTLDSLRTKGIEISNKEKQAALIAILLHDIGHGPFSHALETTILQGVAHESVSILLMENLNKEYSGALDLALEMFRNRYSRRFFYQLISSQLDMDRLDYIQRDCFFTGVSEGKIGADRIIRMLNVHDDKIVVEEKGIYSIENFLSARRLMYWQVYLHKTTVSTEQMLIKLIQRARFLSLNDYELAASPFLSFFLKNEISFDDFKNGKVLHAFANLDDSDIWGAIKEWQLEKDPVISKLSRMILNRDLFKVHLSNIPFAKEDIKNMKSRVKKEYSLSKGRDSKYFYAEGSVTNSAYLAKGQDILIKMKDGRICDIAEASDLPTIKALSKIVRKYYFCHPKKLTFNS